jgi:hypothetical protein
MKHQVKLCNNAAQDSWADLYFSITCALVDTYEMLGKGVVREAVRKFAAKVGLARKETLLAAGCKTNLKTFFHDGFGFPCGDRSKREWIRHTEQETFVNVVSCPYAQRWMARPALGRMFCEEYYSVLVHEGTCEKAQINLGYTMLNDRNDYCRLSIYLRPANVPMSMRGQCFPEFDPEAKNMPLPDYTPDFETAKVHLLQGFIASAEERMDDDCVNLVYSTARAYAQKHGDKVITDLLGE